MNWEDLKKNKVFRIFYEIWRFLVKQWFFVFLGVFIGLAYRFPQFAKQGGMIKAEYSIEYGAVAVIFLISGLSMPSKELFANILHWRAHFTVLSMSFLITSSIIYGIVCGIKASKNTNINDWALVGMIVTFCCPTTVSSNVVMTKQADGNDVLTLCEVFLGNVLGAFITPALVQMYARGEWEFGNPTHQADGDGNVKDLYRQVMKQLGLSVFVPLFVGQVAQNVFPKFVKKFVSMFKLGKIGSFMLLLIMYQSFSTAFAQNAFEDVSHATIIFIVFFNIGIYLFFTVLCYAYSRPIFIKRAFEIPPDENSTMLYKFGYNNLRSFYYNKRDTVAVMLCGPAKTAALGVSLISSQYGSNNPKLGILLVPLVLFQAEQVVTAQVLVVFMKKWVHLDDPKSDEEAPDEASAGSNNADNEEYDNDYDDDGFAPAHSDEDESLTTAGLITAGIRKAENIFRLISSSSEPTKTQPD
ncbi:uncharacterized protein PRCAT00004786001 [Priceomyces carsonii]|uniref:uncharacterized protein n=1 Tax=Priceomyces carsonii TaxID=28549 RepID=UPI002ED9AD7C|nr:unnamed protein product [Priceomyces carsonii]